MKQFTTITISLLFSIQCLAQKNKIISGPMLGYVEHREVMLWFEVDSSVSNIDIVFHEINNPLIQKKVSQSIKPNCEFRTVKVVLENLQPSTNYVYEVFVDDLKQTFDFATNFTTKTLWEWRTSPPDFSFLFGSCVYINDSLYDRPGKPYGASPKILNAMAEIKTDFIIWGGDNVYLREADYSSMFGIKYRYNYNFRIKEFQKLRATRANYAIWDDHDFGPNDGDKTFELADASFHCFENYWANKTFGENGKGVYTKVRWSDCEFFLLDGRTFRSPDNMKDSVSGKPNPDKEFLGKQQILWLKNNLISSKATFKFIINGGQVLNPTADKECMQHYPYEYFDLINCINENKINGVVFLTGDRHFTELQRVMNLANYPLYDFTCSSITSGVYSIVGTEEFKSSTRIDGSLLMENNFSKISITGAKNNRKIRFEVFDGNGLKKWNYEFEANELK